MSFAVFEAEISRVELGQAPLNINDFANYQVTNEILGGAQTWQRQTVRSPYVDGEFTVNATRGQVEEKFGIQVKGASQSIMQANIATLIEAISQFRFELRIQQDDATYTYACEAADYTVDWSQARMMARQALVTLMIRRSPKLVSGGW